RRLGPPSTTFPSTTLFRSAVARDVKGLNELIERLRGVEPSLVAVEATGGFETIVAAAIAGAHLPLAVVNPAQVRHFAQAIGKRADRKSTRLNSSHGSISYA